MEATVYAEERQQAMVRQVAARGRLSVAELAAAFHVTTETVRRDLTVLERLGMVRRLHGGAVPASALTSLEEGLAERDAAHTAEKDRIARAALDLLPPAGTSVLLDAGTTTARFASELPRGHRLVVFTHSVPVAARLAGNPAVELHLLPGRVRETTQAAVGPATVAALSRLRTDVVFVGANGVSVEHGLSTPDPDEAATKQALVGAGQRVVLLADASKLGVQTTIRFATLEEIDVLVTDSSIAEDLRAGLAGTDLEVVVA